MSLPTVWNEYSGGIDGTKAHTRTGAVQKGMPYKVYHGKTGVIYNVTKSAVGVILYVLAPTVNSEDCST